MRVILLGPPGAGKGTQCKRIAEKYGLAHLSSGDILRAERAAGTELGRKAQSYMDSGGLVPDDLIIDMMIGAIKKTGGRGYVLDGFPRTVAQAEGLDAAMERAGEKIDVILSLEVPDEAILERMTGRRSCPKCGAVYHIVNLRPKVDGQCDKGCGPLIQRQDDSPEVVMNRLKTYHEQTEAVLGYYQKNKRNIVRIDADQPIDEVTRAVFEALEALR
ncbi:MAG TPA: adenylate kinase [Anaerohalosphaeraceae bacterium]|jgi:adenylate kinase|nr:adenylate kinase [Phycisphaerae bacterium]HOT71916.1 adenylate kinase [Anaerohalosphaeraceae bacterium]HQG05282.1 adenylate kinase [Anaerohalosphaeraceae bacterium]HQI07000.1 adenylate kinase [Anaerohalosphaeraceae bacterium]HQJ66696.1 adenylate kinase [Anaerohalosphaeraceae bacterium]